MAAPASTWEFNQDLFGNDVPHVFTLKAAAGLETKVGTLVKLTSGRVSVGAASVQAFLGLAAEETDGPLADGDPIKVYIIRPGMVIKGIADADASALSGFNGKTIDMNADGTLDVADTTNGCLSVYRTEDSGLTVYCVPNGARMALQ